MSIDIEPGTLSRMREYSGSIWLQVRGASDPDKALEALRKAREEILKLKGADIRYFVEATPIPTGPFLYLDAGQTPYSVLKTFPGIIARSLEQKGITDATVSGTKTDEWKGDLSRVSNAVVMCAFLPPPKSRSKRSVPPSPWYDVSAEWVTDGLAPEAEVMASISNTRFLLPAAQSRSFFEQSFKPGPATCLLISGDLSSRVRGANWRFRDASLALAGGGPEVQQHEVVSIFQKLVAVARELARERLAYAFVSLEPTFGPFRNLAHATTWSVEGGERHEGLRHIWDEFVFDAFPYQILGPGHIERVGGMPPGARDLGDGKVELFLGEPSQWVIGPPAEPINPFRGQLRAAAKRRKAPLIQIEARQAIQPLLLRRGEGFGFWRARYFPEESQH